MGTFFFYAYAAAMNECSHDLAYATKQADKDVILRDMKELAECAT